MPPRGPPAQPEAGAVPRKPKRPCAHPGCPALADGQYCPEHQKLANRQYEQYIRDPATHARYGKAWRRARARHLAAHPLCETCKEAGRLVSATTVHHRVKLADGGSHVPANLQSLCKGCHSALHLRERNRGRGHSHTG